MSQERPKNVAVLLATYNGARYVDAQIRSLRENETAFTLHWIDDHSKDRTRELVRESAGSVGIPLKEWHQPQHLGVPATFFQLLESVEADIYLFCDQDDIWQSGKIDATVNYLSSQLGSPSLCFSDAWVFDDREPRTFRRESEIFFRLPEALEESKMFIPACANGHTQGFTRPLRDMFIRHKDIARQYGAMHDVWMYNLAVASGTARMLQNVPTTLYRQHTTNVIKNLVSRKGGPLVRNWRKYQLYRRYTSRNAQGFILASPTIPSSPRLMELVKIARLLSTLDRRQSPAALLRLARKRVWSTWGMVIGFAMTCMFSDATSDQGKSPNSAGSI